MTLTGIGLLLVLGAAEDLLAEGERHVVPQLAHDQPHLPRLEVEEARLVADLQTVGSLSFTSSLRLFSANKTGTIS